jgi:hypothetical protein
MYGDAHVEEDDIPWVFHYALHDDPFARGDRRIPIQPPPAGYVPNHPLKPVLKQFFGGPKPDPSPAPTLAGSDLDPLGRFTV